MLFYPYHEYANHVFDYHKHLRFLKKFKLWVENFSDPR